jgi:hypothetical protein
VRFGSLLLALALVLPLRLLPPGFSEKKHPGGGRLPMPAALTQPGPRATPADPPVHLHAYITPSPARLGQQLVYRAYAWVPRGGRITFAPPEPGGDFTWGEAKAGRVTHGYWYSDSAWVEVPLEVFRTGHVAIPGLAVQLVPGTNGGATVTRLPTLQLLVVPTLTAADTNATLRPLHGPLVAPWWERMPWRYVVFAALLIALAFALWRWLDRRRRKPVLAPAPIAHARPAIDPSAEALAALAKLRDQALPEQGRFGEHALALTRIQRRFLERTLGTPRPGDTSPELLMRLRASQLEPEDVTRLEGLLGLWDRVKFARAALDAGEAHRCEDAVERLVRRRESPREVA